MNAESELPEGWISIEIPEICEINPKKPSRDSIHSDTPVTFVPMPAVDADMGAITEPERRKFGDVRNGFTFFQDGDVIFAKITPCMENGKAAIARNLINGLGFGSTEFFTLRSNGTVIPEYIYHFIRQESFRKAAEENMTGSVGQKRVPKHFIENSIIPLPPLAEQRRIVAAVEALLARVNASRERLDRVPGLLKAFRLAVLAAACNGRLTEGWREEHPETKSVIDDLKYLVEKRKNNFKNKTQLQFELEIPAIHDIIEDSVPPTWYITKLGFLAHVTKLAGFEYTKYFKLEDSGNIPVIRAQNVQMGKFIPENLKFISKNVHNQLPRSQVHGNEILIVYVGAGVGNVSLAPTGDRWHLSSNVGKVTPDWINREYLLYYLQSEQGFQRVLSRSKATAQPSLSMDSIRQVLVAVPPLSEQHEIVRRVETLFALADRIEQRVAAGKDRTDRLTQAILAKAFRGELVPTEAELARREGREYEPASVLLERIKGERESQGKGKPRTRKIRSEKGEE